MSRACDRRSCAKGKAAGRPPISDRPYRAAGRPAAQHDRKRDRCAILPADESRAGSLKVSVGQRLERHAPARGVAKNGWICARCRATPMRRTGIRDCRRGLFEAGGLVPAARQRESHNRRRRSSNRLDQPRVLRQGRLRRRRQRNVSTAISAVMPLTRNILARSPASPSDMSIAAWAEAAERRAQTRDAAAAADSARTEMPAPRRRAQPIQAWSAARLRRASNPSAASPMVPVT